MKMISFEASFRRGASGSRILEHAAGNSDDAFIFTDPQNGAYAAFTCRRKVEMSSVVQN
jgi:hypothetical protein